MVSRRGTLKLSLTRGVHTPGSRNCFPSTRPRGTKTKEGRSLELSLRTRRPVGKQRFLRGVRVGFKGILSCYFSPLGLREIIAKSLFSSHKRGLNLPGTQPMISCVTNVCGSGLFLVCCCVVGWCVVGVFFCFFLFC
jgi:hypothetical protein